MNIEDQETKVKGIKVSDYHTGIIIVVFALVLGLITATYFLSQKYENLVVNTSNYITLEKQADIVQDASDYLTEQVRLYVQTLDIQHVNLYFKEVNDTQRREHALSKLEECDLADSWDYHMEEAVHNSNELMTQEIYAMKLVAIANSHNISNLPQEVQDMELEAQDVDLDSQMMLEKARDMVFGEDYQHKKAVIYEHLDQFTHGVLFSIENRIGTEIEGLSGTLMFQRILLMAFAVLIIVVFVALTVLVFRPLRSCLKCIEEGTMLESVGSYEFKRIAQVYNDTCSCQDLNQEDRAQK